MNYDTLDNAPTMDGGDHEGRLLADRYRIVRKLGEGGMGMVYLAVDTELADHTVAIKFIPPMLAGNARAVKNLKREALTAMQLSHPNIVRLHDLHTDGHQKFLVMEYIEGKTLDDVLAEADAECLSLETVLGIVTQLAAGLDHAHSKQVLHRDLKPSNIMVGDDGSVKLLDFGIAREIKDSYTRVTGNLTSGTLPYMSPEQLMGENPTVAMDVYSLGAVTYECLAGHPPFHMGDIRRQIEVKEPEPIPALPDPVNRVLLQVLDKESGNRPTSAGALVLALKATELQPTNTVPSLPDPVPVVPPGTPPASPPLPDKAMPRKATPVKKATGPDHAKPEPLVSQGRVKTHRKPRVLKVWLLGSLVFSVGSALEKVLWFILMSSGANRPVATLISSVVWALWCGLGTVLCLQKLQLSRDRRLFVRLPLAWGALWFVVVLANNILMYQVGWPAATGILRALGTFLAGVILLFLLRREGIRLSSGRSVLFAGAWFLGDLSNWLTASVLVGGILHHSFGAMGMLFMAFANGLGGFLQGAFYVYLIRRFIENGRCVVGAPPPKVMPPPHASNRLETQGVPIDNNKKPRLMLAVLANSLLWAMGMGLGMVLFEGLDHGSRLGEIELASLAGAMWGLWCGAVTAGSLMVLGLIQHRRAVLVLALAWGGLWPLTVATASAFAEEVGSLPLALATLFLGILASIAVYVVILRREGWPLSGPRILLMTVGWLAGIVLHIFISVICTVFLFDELMGMPEEIAIFLGVGIGGMTLGSLSILMTHALTMSQRTRFAKQEQ